ncbi:MAG TPA: TetR family transcriptional regulator, partial [Acidimicrobiales bacterium]
MTVPEHVGADGRGVTDARVAPVATAPGFRRHPQQARSRERVARVLEAADRVLGTEGFGALTVRRLAEEAGVPVGTIYQ